MQGPKCSLGMKPCILFAGEQFDTDAEYGRLRNLLIGNDVMILFIYMPSPFYLLRCQIHPIYLDAEFIEFIKW